MLTRVFVLSALVISMLVGATSKAEARYVWNHTAAERADISYPLNHNYRWAIFDTDEIASDKCISNTLPEKRYLGQYAPWNRQAALDNAQQKHQDMRKADSKCSAWGISRPPHYNEWMCIHSGEGAWNANTGNGYYGGLQMDVSFQASYAPAWLRATGTADKWTPYQQMWVAENALRAGRGFYPWPTTARNCGLI